MPLDHPSAWASLVNWLLEYVGRTPIGEVEIPRAWPNPRWGGTAHLDPVLGFSVEPQTRRAPMAAADDVVRDPQQVPPQAETSSMDGPPAQPRIAIVLD